MAPVEGRNVRSMFLTSCLAVIFGLKLLEHSPIPTALLKYAIYERLRFVAYELAWSSRRGYKLKFRAMCKAKLKVGGERDDI